MPTVIVETPVQIAQHYSAAMDSVALIASLKAKALPLSVDDASTLKRNVDHLTLMLAKTYWTTENLAPLQTSIV